MGTSDGERLGIPPSLQIPPWSPIRKCKKTITMNSIGSMLRSTMLMTVNAERVTWLNFDGRSIVASAV